MSDVQMDFQLSALPSAAYFIGGSDARTIMGDDEAALLASGARSGAKSTRRTCPGTSSSSLAW